MEMLVISGADTEWTEPNGTIINKVEIMSWCSMDGNELKVQSEFPYAFCEAGHHSWKYPLYATQEQVHRYVSTHGSPSAYA